MIRALAVVLISALHASVANAFVAQSPRAVVMAPPLYSTPPIEPGEQTARISPPAAAVPPPPGTMQPPMSSNELLEEAKHAIWDTATTQLIQGQSLRTFPVERPIDRVHISMKTEGRPLTAAVELWHGPDYTATTMKVYVEDGSNEFNAIVATPKDSNTIAVYNKASMEFPMFSCLQCETDGGATDFSTKPLRLKETTVSKKVQGGAVRSFAFEHSVQSVQVLMNTDGRNLKARIELLQGPNNIKQVIDFYSSDGYKRPFYAVIETPGTGNMIRLVNENTVEFPFNAHVEPYIVDSAPPNTDISGTVLSSN